jgi:acyl-CoA hydrolase
VNPRIPFTYGSTLVPVSWVTGLIKSEHRLPTLSKPEISEEDRAIAGHVAELIEDGSTLQFGIGGIPNALGAILEQRRDLGIHTEMINDTIMHLCQSGAVNGRLKSIWPGRTVGAFAFGSEDLYEFCHHNAGLEFHPASVVNDRDRIGRNTKMISINTAVEVDLTGQVCSESVGHRELSGVGGATDTHVGAQRSSGGKGIVALRSRNAKTDESKIVFELKPGAKVSISRNDIDTVVTEYGVAKLRGRTVAQRVREMVGIAHPDEREELLRQARGCGYL